jgi:hypothetical protein
METKVCPKCGKPGSLQTKMVRNNYGTSYQYDYFAHYGGREGSLTRINWHYVGKRRPEKVGV